MPKAVPSVGYFRPADTAAIFRSNLADGLLASLLMCGFARPVIGATHLVASDVSNDMALCSDNHKAL